MSEFYDREKHIYLSGTYLLALALKTTGSLEDLVWLVAAEGVGGGGGEGAIISEQQRSPKAERDA